MSSGPQSKLLSALNGQVVVHSQGAEKDAGSVPELCCNVSKTTSARQEALNGSADPFDLAIGEV